LDREYIIFILFYFIHFIYRWRGAGLWIVGAFWSLPFQLIITPFPWAGGTAVDVANRVRTELVCQAHHEEARRGNGGSPTGAVEETQRIESAYTPFIPMIHVNLHKLKGWFLGLD
jgi:hypothetical protein